MSPRYAVVFALLAVPVGLFGVAAIQPTAGISLLFLYPALSFLVLAVAYGGGGPNLLGKRPDGGRGSAFRLLLAPYLLLTRLGFWLYKLSGRHTAVCEVVPRLYLGRRLTGKEAEQFANAAVLDLAAEFGETSSLRRPGRYLSLPVLDATPPTTEQFNIAVEWIVEHLSHRPVFVHCALGHGRSVSVVIAYLLTVGPVHSVKDGVRYVRKLRPGMGLSTNQRRALDLWCQTRTTTGGR